MSGLKKNNMPTQIHMVQFQKGEEAIAMCGAKLRRSPNHKEPPPWTIFNNRATCPSCSGRYDKPVKEDDYEWEDF